MSYISNVNQLKRFVWNSDKRNALMEFVNSHLALNKVFKFSLDLQTEDIEVIEVVYDGATFAGDAYFYKFAATVVNASGQSMGNKILSSQEAEKLGFNITPDIDGISLGGVSGERSLQTTGTEGASMGISAGSSVTITGLIFRANINHNYSVGIRYPPGTSGRFDGEAKSLPPIAMSTYFVLPIGLD